MTTETYSFPTAKEGGPGQKYAMDIAREIGAAKVRTAGSIYEGHTAIIVTATRAQHKAIANAILN